MPVDEEQLTEALSKVLLKEDIEIDGLDEDLVAYMAGLLSSKIEEDEGDDDATPESAVDEVLVPFLESVACPEQVTAKAKTAMIELLVSSAQSTTSATQDDNMDDAGPTRKLKQGLVNMASTLSNPGSEADEDANRYLWGTSTGVKPSANQIIDAHTDKTSAKDKRKRRQELEQSRRALDAANQSEDDKRPTTLVNMSAAAFKNRDSKSKQKDVQVRNVNVSLDNGTILLDGGDIKFAYQRRYGLIGENGVGKPEKCNECGGYCDRNKIDILTFNFFFPRQNHIAQGYCQRRWHSRISGSFTSASCATRNSRPSG